VKFSNLSFRPCFFWIDPPHTKASLRAAVFTVVDEHERSSGVHVPNPAALDVKHDEGGAF